MNNRTQLDVSRSERICRICDEVVIGDEIHFLFECPKLEDLRIKYMALGDRMRPNVYGQGSQKLYNSSLKLSKNEVHCRQLYDTNLSSTTYHLNISKTKRRWDNCTYMFRPLQYRSRVWNDDTSRLL